MALWLPFFLAVLLGAAMLYAPGVIVARSCGMRGADAWCVAPPVSLALMGILSMVYEPLSIHADLLTLWVIPTFLLFAIYLLVMRVAQRPKNTDGEVSGLDWASIALYAAIGFIIGMIVYVKPLDGPSSYFLGWDSVRHINGVQAYAESGHMSSLSSSLYETTLDSQYMPTTSVEGFYPSNWYIVAALLTQVFGPTATLATNACNFLFSSLVYPISMALLMERLFPGQRRVVRAGAYICLCCTTFPWMFYAYGPLYPNAAALAVLPAVSVLWMDLVGYEGALAPRLSTLVVALAAAMGMALLHPSALFTLSIVGLVFIVYRLYHYEGKIRLFSLELDPHLCSLLFVLAFCALWVIAGKLPFMQSVMGYSWGAFSTVGDMIVFIATMSYTQGWVPAVAAQPVLAILLAIGLIAVVRNRRASWIAALYLVFCAMLLVGATTDGEIKRILIGFWYSDHNRVAAMCAVFATPLVAAGLDALCALFEHLVPADKPSEHLNGILGICVPTLAMVLALLPSYPLYGKTAFGLMYEQLKLNQEPHYGPLHWEERGFMEEVMKLVPDGAMVANAPYDGSIATYGVYDLHVLYRTMGTIPSPSESENSVLVRTSLDRIATDNQVRAAAEELGIEYVIQMHTDDVEAMYPGAVECAAAENWTGIYGITPETPGFQLLLSQDDLALYRVAYESL